jgi:hypothetical protein
MCSGPGIRSLDQFVALNPLAYYAIVDVTCRQSKTLELLERFTQLLTSSSSAQLKLLFASRQHVKAYVSAFASWVKMVNRELLDILSRFAAEEDANREPPAAAAAAAETDATGEQAAAARAGVDVNGNDSPVQRNIWITVFKTLIRALEAGLDSDTSVPFAELQQDEDVAALVHIAELNMLLWVSRVFVTTFAVFRRGLEVEDQHSGFGEKSSSCSSSDGSRGSKSRGDHIGGSSRSSSGGSGGGGDSGGGGGGGGGGGSGSDAYSDSSSRGSSGDGATGCGSDSGGGYSGRGSGSSIGGGGSNGDSGGGDVGTGDGSTDGGSGSGGGDGGRGTGSSIGAGRSCSGSGRGSGHGAKGATGGGSGSGGGGGGCDGGRGYDEDDADDPESFRSACKDATTIALLLHKRLKLWTAAGRSAGGAPGRCAAAAAAAAAQGGVASAGTSVAWRAFNTLPPGVMEQLAKCSEAWRVRLGKGNGSASTNISCWRRARAPAVIPRDSCWKAIAAA